MSAKEIDLVALAKNVWSHKRSILYWAISGLIFGAIIGFSMPKEYSAGVKIMPEGQSSDLQGSMGALAGFMGVNTTDQNSQSIPVSNYSDVLSSTPFLMEFADIKVNYNNQQITLAQYLLEEQKMPWWKHILSAPSDLVNFISNIGESSTDTLSVYSSPYVKLAFTSTLSDRIAIITDNNTNLSELTVRMQDPIITKQIADSVLNKLQIYTTAYKTKKTRDNLESTTKMLEEAKEKYYLAEQLYAEKADKNLNVSSKSAQIMLDRLRTERDLAGQIYQQLALQVETTKVKLQEETIIATVIEPATEPLWPSAPNKKLIIIGAMLLFSIAKIGTVIIKFTLKTSSNAI